MEAKMATTRNPFSVAEGQVWKDNDPRSGDRRFKVLSVDAESLPHGTAEVELVTPVKPGRRPRLTIGLHRFNGTRRGYSLVS